MNFTEEKLREGFTKHHIHGLSRSAVIHVIEEVDGDLAHDHPFGFWSFVISGSYVERVHKQRSNGEWYSYCKIRRPGNVVKVEAAHVHQIIALPEGKCETLILPGPWEREWGTWSFEDGKATFIKQ